MDLFRFLDGDFETERRRFLGGLTTIGLGAVAGCSGGADDSPTQPTQTTRETTTTGTTTTATETTTTDQQTTTTAEEVSVADVRDKRQRLTASEKREFYRDGIPSIDDYELDFNRVQQENDTRREQLIDITATVGDQFEDYVDGNHAVMNAIHNLDWMNWENDNILNIVTRRASKPGEHVLANYSTEDGGRNLDGTIARDSASGEETYVENIPDSEVMDGDGVNLLITDIEAMRTAKDAGRIEPEGWENIQMEMQSILPRAYGPDINNGPVRNRNIIFDGEAVQYTGESYNDSAEAVNEVSEESMEIEMATVPVRNSGRYVEVTANENGLEVDSIYSQAKGEEKMREPVEL